MQVAQKVLKILGFLGALPNNSKSILDIVAHSKYAPNLLG
jgi:hypothetical protein